MADSDLFPFMVGPKGRNIVVDASGRLVFTGETGTAGYVFQFGPKGRPMLVDASGRLYISPHSLISADNVPVATIGTPEVNKLQESIDVLWSTGAIGGGEITDLGTGAIAVAAGSGFIRSVNNPRSVLKSFEWAALPSGALTDTELNYVYVEYNSGAPQVAISTSVPTEYNTNILLGKVFASGLNVKINNETQHYVASAALNTILRLQETAPMARVSGAVMASGAVRTFAVTQGAFWEGLNRYTTPAFDSSGSDTFTAYYRDGATGWSTEVSQTALSNTKYDDNSGVLADLTAGKYGIHWIFLGVDGSVYSVYGQGDYSLPEAQEVGVPGTLPPEVSANARLIAKAIVYQGAAQLFEVSSAWENTYDFYSPTDHGSLVGLLDDDHPQYYHQSRDAIPSADVTYDLGSTSNRFAEVHARHVDIDVDTAIIGLDIDKTNTGTGNCIDINNAGTGNSLSITQSGNETAVYVNKTGIGSGNGVSVANAGGGYGVRVNQTGGGVGLFVSKTSTDAYQSAIITQTGAEDAIEINQNADGIGIDINKTHTGSADCVTIDYVGTGRGIAITKTHSGGGTVVYISNAGSGSGLAVVPAAGSIGPGVSVITASTATGNCFQATSEGSGDALELNVNSTGIGIDINKTSTGAGHCIDVSNAGTGACLKMVPSNAGATAAVEIASTVDVRHFYLTRTGAGSAQAFQLDDALSGDCFEFNKSGNGCVLDINKTGTGAGNVIDLQNDGSGVGFQLTQAGASNGIYVDRTSTSASSAVRVAQAGTAPAIYASCSNNGGRAARFQGGQQVLRTAPAAGSFPYTALLNDYYIGVTDTSVARTINLPPAATAESGCVYVIKDESGVCSVNNITIDADGGELIDGATTYVLSSNWASATLICTGTAWMVI